MNILEQGPGFHKNVLKWMIDTAKQKELPSHGYEMAIQEDIQIDKKGGKCHLSGTTHYGEDGDNLEIFRNGRKLEVLASHGLQLEFLGHTGFKFPFAQFPTRQAQAYHLYAIFWDAVIQLSRINFKAQFYLFDGASAEHDV
jgi:hypothetical protein